MKNFDTTHPACWSMTQKKVIRPKSMSKHCSDSKILPRVGFKCTPASAPGQETHHLSHLSVAVRSDWIALKLYFTAFLPGALVFWNLRSLEVVCIGQFHMLFTAKPIYKIMFVFRSELISSAVALKGLMPILWLNRA